MNRTEKIKLLKDIQSGNKTISVLIEKNEPVEIGYLSEDKNGFIMSGTDFNKMTYEVDEAGNKMNSDEYKQYCKRNDILLLDGAISPNDPVVFIGAAETNMDGYTGAAEAMSGDYNAALYNSASEVGGSFAVGNETESLVGAFVGK